MLRACSFVGRAILTAAAFRRLLGPYSIATRRLKPAAVLDCPLPHINRLHRTSSSSRLTGPKIVWHTSSKPLVLSLTVIHNAIHERQSEVPVTIIGGHR